MNETRARPVSLRRRIARYAIHSVYAARPGKPRLKWRALRSYARYLVTGEAPLRFCDIAVTYDCTMSCRHCSAARLGDRDRRAMGLADYRRLGDELVRGGALAVQLTGGEPLVRPDLEQVIAALGPERLFVSIVTNSSLVTRARLGSLAAAGLDNLCVSVDDFDAVEHDLCRGSPGNRAQALDALDTALEMGLRGMVFHIVTPESLRREGFARLVEHTRRRGVLLVLGWAVPAGRWSGRHEVLVSDEDLDYLEAVQERFLHVRTDFDTNYFHRGCGAAKEKLYVTPYGDVMPCAFVHVGLGNVLERPLVEIRRDAMNVEWFRRYHGRCLAATDPEFVERHMSRISAAPREPASLIEAGLLEPATGGPPGGRVLE